MRLRSILFALIALTYVGIERAAMALAPDSRPADFGLWLAAALLFLTAVVLFVGPIADSIRRWCRQR